MELTTLLWDFDDYLSVETFDEQRSRELLMLCRSTALKMHNILVQTHLELLSKISDSDSSFDIVQESLDNSHHPESRPSSSQYRQEEIQTDDEAPSPGNATSHNVNDRFYPGSRSGRKASSVNSGLEFAATDSRQFYISELAPGREKENLLVPISGY